MANGVAIALPLAEEPTPAQEEVIGQAIASATTALCFALLELQQDGRLDPATREAGGNRVAKVATLMLDHALGDQDFLSTARAQGKVQLRRYLNGSFAPAQSDAALDFHIDNLLEIVTRVVADERVFRRAAAN